MEKNLLSPIRTWNLRRNRLPQKFLLALLALLITAVFLFLLKYLWPFLLALVFSSLIEPLAGRMERRLKNPRIARRLGTLLGMLLLFGVAGAGVTILLQWLLQELFGLVKGVPRLVGWLESIGLPYAMDWYDRLRLLISPYLSSAISTAVNQLTQSFVRWAGNVSAALTSGAFATALSIPDALLSVMLTLMGTYSLSADRPRILRWYRSAIPERWRKKLGVFRDQLSQGIFGQLKSQLIVSLITALLLALAFMIYGIPSGFLFGLLIGLADSLPLIGAGFFLIPWSLVSFLFGQSGRGIFLLCAYLGIVLLRQLLEPRIVGKNLGLYPPLTMAAMYAGYRAMGFFGLLLGPVVLNVMKAVMAAELPEKKADIQPAKMD